MNGSPLILSSGNWREKKKSREKARGRKFGREHFPRRFGPEEVLQDQRGNSGDFSVLGCSTYEEQLSAFDFGIALNQGVVVRI
ncbi:hypothetical protein CDAR_289111 [Caerostris darwini]|uniref:Uncharacterized protein n=1 Tax=Caerostris darwini TaxID=1538125 RepID=A0AAV4PKS6_9ARAC|nr:hypothetical protein CDAR_289111 [Caerostris darwini]